MAGGISSLGVGSGVLTADIIDKLKESDENRVIKPLEDKITLSNQKEDAFKLLSSLMATFKASASALNGDNLYLSRSVNGNTDAVSVTAESGSNVQEFSISDVSKAESDVWNSTALNSHDKTIDNLGSGTLSIALDGKDYDIDYTSATTLDDVKKAINELASDVMTASILQVGEGSYELVITAKDTNKAITFTDSNNDSVATQLSLATTLSLNNVQVAKSATFKYNGIDIQRDTNEISDLITGVTITLNENQAATDSASIKIVQNKASISTEIALFVTNYNSLITNLQDMTSSDRENGAVGIFNGESFVKSISRELTSIITSVDSDGNSLVDYGISIDRNGVMSLDKNVFANKYVTDAAGMESFFSGNSETQSKGIFTKLNDKMTQYTGYNQLMSNFSDKLETSKDALISQHEQLTKSLDDRYAILKKRFIAYDAIISRINTQFSSLQMMIDAEVNAKK
jgi:flagellar hook-associated protein 2